MRYDNLHDLLMASSSTRQYFLSLPVKLQLSLHQHNDYIHTAQELHLKAGMMENYERHCMISDGKL